MLPIVIKEFKLPPVLPAAPPVDPTGFVINAVNTGSGR